ASSRLVLRTAWRFDNRVPVAALVDDRASPALGQPRLAGVAAVQDQPMMRVAPERLRNTLLQPCLDLFGGLARGETRAVGDAEHVRVDRESLLPECAVEHDVRRLAADSRQPDQRLAVGRHLAAVLGDEPLAE